MRVIVVGAGEVGFHIAEPGERGPDAAAEGEGRDQKQGDGYLVQLL